MQTNNHADRRRWIREPIAIPVALVFKAKELKSDTSTGTINISLSGLSVQTNLALSPGQELLIAIKDQFSHTIPARVVWILKDGSCGRTIAGLKILSYPIAIVP